MEDLMRENVGEAQNEELLTSLTIEETFEELDNLLDMLEQSDNSLFSLLPFFLTQHKNLLFHLINL